MKKMNMVMETISKRRSIRSYHSKLIPREMINTVIEAGNQAPSTLGMVNGVMRFQPWRFVVVENPDFKKDLIQTTYPAWRKIIEGLKAMDPDMYGEIMKLYDAMPEPKDMVYHSAPVIIFVIGPASNAVSCALACQNMMLSAVSLGLGSCYVGFGSMVKGDPDIVKSLELTDDERIYGPIVLGYPKDDSSKRFMDQHETSYVEPTIKWI